MNNNNLINMNMKMHMGMNPNVLETPYEGYIKGNMFKNLYVPYKNFKPYRLVPNNEQAEMLLNINQLQFAAHEIRLYLDNFPNDSDMIRKFNEYTRMYNDAVNRYQNMYGPIMSNALSDENLFSWVVTSWPWEMED